MGSWVIPVQDQSDGGDTIHNPGHDHKGNIYIFFFYKKFHSVRPQRKYRKSRRTDYSFFFFKEKITENRF